MNASVPGEVLQDPANLRWIPIGAGIDFRLLFTSGETGRWTVLFRCQPGSFFPRHKHYGAGEYFVVKGRMEYRMGVALEGTYGYEPLGVTHDLTTFPEYTELLFTNFGPVVYLNEDDSIASILDHSLLEKLAASG
ncbi:MAG: 2,4'-dihydroxyacetophenone dioxygenase family protein [Gammaproteobacteria bacterium]